MEISQPQILQGTQVELMFLPVDSLVSHTLWQENGSAKKITDTSGQKCLEQFGKLNRNGSWAKTFMGLLIGMEGWYSRKCKLTWKLKGTKYKRLYFQLAVSELPIGEIESGLLPTPCRYNENGRSEGWSPSLLQVVNSLLPTPNARDWKGETGHENQFDLNREVRKLLLTPIATSDAKGGCTRSDESRQNDTLAHAAHGLWGTGKTSQLNPRFVAEMMGFPPDWLELPFQDTDANQSKPMETP